MRNKDWMGSAGEEEVEKAEVEMWKEEGVIIWNYRPSSDRMKAHLTSN